MMSGTGKYFICGEGDTNLFFDDLSVDLSCRNVVVTREGSIQVSLVVSEVQVDLSPIVKDINLTCGTSMSGLRGRYRF